MRSNCTCATDPQRAYDEGKLLYGMNPVYDETFYAITSETEEHRWTKRLSLRINAITDEALHDRIAKHMQLNDQRATYGQ